MYELRYGESLKRFILSGLVAFKVKSLKTKNSFLFKVQKVKSGTYPRFSVYIWADGYWQYIGTIYENRLNFSWTRHSREKYKKFFEIFGWLWVRVGSGQRITTAQFTYSGKCARCNRQLKDPESIALGMGPNCRKALS